MARDFENGIASPLSGSDSFISSDIIITGTAIWVDSVNGNNANAGTELLPLQTLVQAITNATANNGDVIIVKASSTITLGSSLSINKAGLKIYGLGTSVTKPTATVTAAVDGINISAADVEFNNFKFAAGTTTPNTSRINIDAARVKIKSCTFTCGVNDLNTITITANGIGAQIENCSLTVSADGPDSGVVIESALAVGVKISGTTFNGGSFGWDDAALYSAFAHTEFQYDGNTLTNSSDIAHTAAAKGWCSGTIAGDGCFVRV